jgi:integrase
VADRLKDYIKEKGIEPEQRIFPITYNAARVMVKKAGKMVGVKLRPHDLRRFCATYASRAGTPIEIIADLHKFSVLYKTLYNLKPCLQINLIVFNERTRSHS